MTSPQIPPAPHPDAPPPAPGSMPAPPNPPGVQITAEDLADLRALRTERSERLARQAADQAEAQARLTPPTHYVHLADGTVVPGSQIGTHHTAGDGTGNPRGDTAQLVALAVPIG
jgi:3-oxoacyl-(acyl-carrier-protein) synthase